LTDFVVHGIHQRVLTHIKGLSGFPVVTRFADEQLDALVSECGFEVVDSRWFSGLLPIRFVVAQLAPTR
jgi:hypothetical protein